MNEFTSEKRGVKRKRNVSTLAFILCTCIIVLLIEFFVLRENHQDKKNIVATEESIIRNNETVIAELRRKLSDSNERKSKLEFDLKDQDMKNKLLMKLLDSILVENNELKQQVGKTHFSISTYPNKENVNTENSYVDVINPPVFAKSSANIGMKIKRVQITSTQTIIDFEYSNYENSIDRISISSKAYLTIDYSTKYYLIRSEGLPVFLSSQYDKVEFRLIFPALPKNTTKFDFREINGLWNFFEIRLK